MNLKKTIEYGLYLLLFTLPWQTRWIFQVGKIKGGESEYLAYSLYGTDVLIIILSLLAGVYFWRTRGTREKKEMSRAKALLAAAIAMFFAFAIAHAPDRSLAMFVTLRLVLALAAMRLLLVFAEKVAAAFWLVFGLVPAAWLGVWQFLTQQTFANKWLGLAKHIVFESGTSVIERYPVGQLPERWLRAYGSFDHPNIFGGAMSVGLIVALWLLAEWYFKKEKEKLRSLLYLAIASLAAGLFTSFSRGAWLGLAAGLLAALVFVAWQKRWLELRPWLVGSAIVVAIFTFFMIPYNGLVTSRFSAQTRLEQKSNSERLASYHQAKTLLGRYALTGAGIGNYVPALEQAEPGNDAWYYQPAHNVWLLIWVELGIVGLLAAVGLFVYGLWHVLKNKNALSLALLMAFAVMSQVDHWWWSLHTGVIFLGILVGISCLNSIESHNAETLT